ncbi:hypothetical protein, partial [uncultured Sphingomonas sp.]|uniref:hypothetical protein n=1 Tax=uncultured Sphingomonas sp. TaxID=158754 RepID=UPI0035CA952E
ALAASYLAAEPLAPLARLLLVRGDRGAARLCAAAFGLLPMLVLTAGQLAVFRSIERAAASPALLHLWTYAVATGPATLLAFAAGRSRGTLWSIRAYAGHLSWWILITAMAAAGTGAASVPMQAVLMMLPSVLPGVTGFLLALADPRAVRTVRL